MLFPLRSLFFFTIVCFTLAISCQTAYGRGKSSLCVVTATDTLPMAGCSDSVAVTQIIANAIDLGVPVYNAGLHNECYHVYEWAAYKILYVYGSHCSEVKKILSEAVEKSHGDYSDIDKAWIMRVAFDKILGEPTKTVSPENSSPNKKPDQKA